jgi:hypothetical protein
MPSKKAAIGSNLGQKYPNKLQKNDVLEELCHRHNSDKDLIVNRLRFGVASQSGQKAPRGGRVLFRSSTLVD